MTGMAQSLFQVLGVWHVVEYEELQRLRQKAVLQCVSICLIVLLCENFLKREISI